MRTFARWCLAGLACVALAVAGAAFAQEYRADGGPPSFTPVSKADLDRRIEEGAAELLLEHQQGGDRTVHYDVAFPADEKEFFDVGGNALLVLSAISRNGDELPIKTVYVRTPHGDVPLSRIATTRSRVSQGSVAFAAYGSYRQDAVYLLPLDLAAGDPPILCDFAVNRTGFVVSKSGLEVPANLRSRQPIKAPASFAALKAFAMREYPGVIPDDAFEPPQ